MEIFKRDGFRCQYCGAPAPDVRLAVDHVHPVALGGTNDPSNLITSCHTCNIGKNDVPLSTVRASRQPRLSAVPGRGTRGPKPSGGKPRNLYLRQETIDLMREVGGGSASAGIEAMAKLAADDQAVKDRARTIATRDAAPPKPVSD
jgi:hypothetical protein